MSTFQLYLLLVLPQIQTVAAILFGFATLASFVGVIVTTGIYFDEDIGQDDVTLKLARLMAKIFIGCSIGMLLTAFLPSTKIILMLIGYELGSSIDGIEHLPADIVEYLREMIRRELVDGVEETSV